MAGVGDPCRGPYDPSDAIGFDSGRVEPGQTIRSSFAGEPGTYEFYCRCHKDLGIVGTITLR